jgi:Tat protein translocase TatB subunit
MPQVGPLEILVVGFVALLIFGPEKLPEMARSIGKGINQMKKMASDVKSEFDVNLAEEEKTSVTPLVASKELSPSGETVVVTTDELKKASAAR